MSHNSSDGHCNDNAPDHEDVERVMSFAGAAFVSIMNAASDEGVCPACLVAALHDFLTQARKQVPHLAPDDSFTVERVLIHPTEGNA